MKNLMVVMFLLMVVAVVGCSKPTQHSQLSQDGWNRQLAEIQTGVDKLEVDIKKMWQDPEIIESLALIEFYEQELKRPRPEPTREEILRELDRLWK